MKHNYDIEVKPVGNGKKKVTIKLDGNVIGSRTSARIYRFALLVTGNQACDLKIAKDWLAQKCKEIDRYQEIIDNVPGSRERYIQFGSDGRLSSQEHMKQKMDYIEDGTIVNHLNTAKDQAETLMAKIETLKSGPQPEYARPYIFSWHKHHKNVPKPREDTRLFDLVELPVIAQIDAIDGQIDTSI